MKPRKPTNSRQRDMSAVQRRTSLCRAFQRLVVVASVLPVFLFAATASGADFDEGWKAYQNGDYERALEQWAPLAKSSSPFAQYSLGVMYEQGQALPVDVDKAIELWKSAAEQGYTKAQHDLALFYIGRLAIPSFSPLK